MVLAEEAYLLDDYQKQDSWIEKKSGNNILYNMIKMWI